MIYLKMPENVPVIHKIYLETLKETLQNCLNPKPVETIAAATKKQISSKSNDNNSRPYFVHEHEAAKIMIQFLINNFDEITIGSVDKLSKIQKLYIEKVIFAFKDADAFRDFHSYLQDIFIIAYNDFTQKGRIIEYKGKKILWDGYEYVKSLDLRVCPYCNANYVTTIQSKEVLHSAGSKARPDLDHFIAKSLFPIFAVSIYNLVPCCGYCNQRFKSDHDTTLDNYYSPFDKSIEKHFKFKLNFKQRYESAFQKMLKLHYSIDESYKMYLALINKKTEKNIVDELGEIVLVKKFEAITKKFDEAFDNSNKMSQLCAAVKELKKASITTVRRNQLAVNILILLRNINNFDFNQFSIAQANELYDILNIVKIYISTIFKFYEIPEEIHDEFEYFNFVDAALGKDKSYSIEVIAVEDDLSIQLKVLNNAVLFQLEKVYSAFKPYINDQIEFACTYHATYKKGLLEDFPFLTDTDLTLEHAIFSTHYNPKHQVLSKLIRDVVLPITQSGNRFE